MAQTLFRLLKKQRPGITLDCLAPKSTFPLLSRMPEINRGIELNIGHGSFAFAARRQMGIHLRKEQYDEAIILTNSWKSALIPFFARIPKRVSWRGEWRYGLLTEVHQVKEDRYPLMIQRFCQLALPKAANPYTMENLQPFWPELKVNPELQQQTLAVLSLSTEQPVLALCPGAEYGPAKRWPAEHFAALAREKLAQGYSVWIVGGPKDHPIAEEINQQTNNGCVNLCGKTNLIQAIDLLSCATVVVTNDSGLMHMAAALKRPIIALYGSSSPKFTPPLATQIKILSLGLECSPCFERVCPLQHFNCLQNLTPNLVSQAITDIVT